MSRRRYTMLVHVFDEVLVVFISTILIKTRLNLQFQLANLSQYRLRVVSKTAVIQKRKGTDPEMR